MTDQPAKHPDAADLEASQLVFQQAEEGEKLPAIDFPTFVLSLSHSALVHMGDAPSPVDGKREVNLALARQTIDLLALLQDKTRGNLSGEEERILDQGLYDLRLRFVEVAKRK